MDSGVDSGTHGRIHAGIGHQAVVAVSEFLFGKGIFRFSLGEIHALREFTFRCMDLDDGGLDGGEDLAQAVIGGDFDLAGEVQDPVSADGFLCELLESRLSVEESCGCGVGDAHLGGIASGDLCVVVAGDSKVIGADLDGFDFFGFYLVAEVDRRLDGRVGVAAGGVGLGVALHDGVGAVQEDGLELYVFSAGHHLEEAAASEGIGMAFEA